MEDSALFAANLPCVPGSEYVIDQMGQINPDQRWGLGTIPGAHFKGGWGPDEDGAYLVRQIGFFDGPMGRIGVALAAHPSDGTYETGQSALNDLAAVVKAHQKEFTPAQRGK